MWEWNIFAWVWIGQLVRRMWNWILSFYSFSYSSISGEKSSFIFFLKALYKICKTFGHAFLGSCCRFPDAVIVFLGCNCCFPWMQLLFSPDIAVVFSVCCCRFPRLLPFLFHAFVQKLLEFVQNTIFFVQKPEEISACFFQFFPDIFYPDLELFCFFPWL